MHTRRFGKTGLDLSVFSLGTMRCLANAQVAHSVLVSALERGINHIETAPGYGQSEQFIGQALRAGVGRTREDLVITTKIVPRPMGANPGPNRTDVLTPQSSNWVEQEVEASLTRLGVDYIDCLAIHGLNTPEHLTWVQTDMWPEIEQLLGDGRVRHVGFSTHGSLELVKDAIATDQFEFINLHYYFFFQRHAPAIALAHAKDMGIFIISPADKGGMLYTPSQTLKQLCDPFDPLRLTYRWLLSDSRITTLSVGPAIPEELDWPLQVANQTGPLNELEKQALERITHHQQAVLGTDQCRQCYACLPCPEAIHIPEILRLRNLTVAYDMTEYGQYRYRMFENAGHWFPGRKGNRCTTCGDCLPRCPEQLNIPKLLNDTHERLKGPDRRRLWG